MEKKINELALFAGAGGGILGGLLLGWRTVCAVEINPYCASVLMQRQNDGVLPPFPIWDDVRTFDGRPWKGIVDVVSGGFPCQAFSRASHGKITARDYWPDMFRIISETQSRFVFSENVSAKAIDKARYDIESLGYQAKCIAVSAKDLGSDHIRERYWLFGDSNNEGESGLQVDAKVERLSQFFTSVWQAEPDQLRVANGVAARVDRIKAIGNGQVPAVVRLAWEILNGIQR
jgi:DNA (cytosine-5)-methyltransferase 1